MRELSTLSDSELVQRCRAGDGEAWSELVERFSRYVYAVATRGFRLAEDDAEDVFQEVFTRVYTHLHTLRNDAALRLSAFNFFKHGGDRADGNKFGAVAEAFDGREVAECELGAEVSDAEA